MGSRSKFRKFQCIVFSKATKPDSSKFFYNASQMETFRSYIYLGVKFQASGSYTEAKNNLYARGFKAYLKLFKAFSNIKPNIKVYSKPVILYSSEISGLIPNYKKLNECSAKGYFFKLCNESVFFNTLKSMQDAIDGLPIWQ